MESIQKQFKMGLIALFCVLLYTTIWMWKFEKKMPYYGYWEGKENEFGLIEAIKQIFIYLFVFDTWFYLTHHFLHIDWLMKHVHSWHHVIFVPLRLIWNLQPMLKMLFILSRQFCKALWDILCAQ